MNFLQRELRALIQYYGYLADCHSEEEKNKVNKAVETRLTGWLNLSEDSKGFREGNRSIKDWDIAWNFKFQDWFLSVADFDPTIRISCRWQVAKEDNKIFKVWISISSTAPETLIELSLKLEKTQEERIREFLNKRLRAVSGRTPEEVRGGIIDELINMSRNMDWKIL